MKRLTSITFFFSLFISSTIFAQCLNSSNNITHVTCFGGNDGSIQISPLNGQAPYTYTWASGSTTVPAGYQLNNLAMGVYAVTVEDNIGCDTVISFTVGEPTAVTVSPTSTSDPICFGSCDGAINLTASGGSPVYAYSIDNGITSQGGANFTNLCAGQYIAVAIDANGCMARDTIVLVDQTVTAQINGNTTLCNGQSTLLNATMSGGTAPYLYLWNTGETTSSITVNLAGNYCVTVTDSGPGCTSNACVAVTFTNFDVHISNPVILGGANAHMYVGDTYAFQTTSNDPSNTSYNWTPAATLSSSTVSNPFAIPGVTTTYYLEATNTITGCIERDTATIEVFNNDPTDTIYVEVAPDSTVFACSNFAPFISGNSGTSGPLSPFLFTPSYGSFTGGTPYGCMGYLSNGSTPEVTDTIMWINCEQLCDTTIFIVTTASCVWPGDTDDDGVANNFDLLPIGLHNGATGTTRSNASINYSCQPALFWGTGTTGNPTVDIKHIDCDGNGTINPTDTNAIILNWAQTHQKNSTTFSSGVDIYIDTTVTNPGDTISLPIILGNGTAPSNGYGIAFTINYDPMGVDTGSVSIDFNNSWLGTLGTDMIGIYKDFYAQGEVEVAMTRINHSSVTGGGAIGYINLTIKDDVLPKSAFVRLDFDISDVRFIDSIGNVIPTTPLPTQILVVDAVSNINHIQKDSDLQTFPNPTNGKLLIRSTANTIQAVQVFDLMGRLLMEESNIESTQHAIDMSTLTNGVYLIQIRTEEGLVVRKIIKQ